MISLKKILLSTKNASQQELDYYLILLFNGTCLDNSNFLYSFPKDLAGLDNSNFLYSLPKDLAGEAY